MDHGGKLALAELILGAGDAELNSVAGDPALITAAQVQGRCAQLALARLYGGGSKIVKDITDQR